MKKGKNKYDRKCDWKNSVSDPDDSSIRITRGLLDLDAGGENPRKTDTISEDRIGRAKLQK